MKHPIETELAVRPILEPLEDRIVPVANSLRVVGAGAGAPPRVLVFDTQTQTQIADFTPFNPAFRGGVSVGVGDFNGDGVDDVIVGAGPGGGPHVRVFRGIGTPGGPVVALDQAGPLADFFAFEAGFRGGVNVAMGDVDPGNDSGGETVRDEIIVGSGPGRANSVRIFRNNNIIANTTHVIFNATAVVQITPFTAGFQGGVTVASADLDGPNANFPFVGAFELIVGAGPGGGPHVQAFRGVFGPFGDLQNFDVQNPLASFFAYDVSFRGGVSVAAGPLAVGGGGALIITGAGAGGGPHVRAFAPIFAAGDGAAIGVNTATPVVDFFPFDSNFRGGVQVGFEPTIAGLLVAQGANPQGPSLFAAFAPDANGVFANSTGFLMFSIFNNGLFVSH